MNGTAYSIDGRSFWFEAPLADALPIGAYVTITVTPESRFLGQVLEEAVLDDGAAALDPSAPRRVRGRGNILAELAPEGADPSGAPGPFDSGSVEPAAADVVSAHFTAASGAMIGLELGEVQRVPGVAATLHAGGFARHTFLCGQSGSGKTYTLGVILERLLLNTSIRIAVLDPNSDFVNLRTMRPAAETGLTDDTYDTLRTRYEAVADKIHVFGHRDGVTPFRVRFGRLATEQQAMVLGLDPATDPEEYNAFIRLVAGMDDEEYGLDQLLDAARSSFADDVRRLGLRIENLGVADLSIWAASSEPAIGNTLPDDWRMAVIDLGSLGSQREGSIAAAALLGTMWERRHAREPSILVIDEAHNVCPHHPTGPNQELATEHVIRIAGEGRKYGIYLLLATQRPDKVHPNVLSQCDNLLLMKMNSAADIASLATTFSYAPRALVEQAADFSLGEGLAVGKIAPDPVLFKSGRRLTLEGGSDVPAEWARQS